MTKIKVEYEVDLPDNLLILGHNCNLDESVDDDAHYFCHPTEDMEDDIDIIVSREGTISVIVGDYKLASWVLPNPHIWEGHDFIPNDILKDAVEMAEDRYKRKYPDVPSA